MLLELARPLTLLASMLSLLAVFHAAFLGPEIDFAQRIYESLVMLAIAAGVSLLSGVIFQESGRDRHAHHMSITDTFPVQVFLWTTGIMLAVFVVAWYLETHCIFYRDIRF